MPSENMLVGLVIPATVVADAVAEGQEEDRRLKRRHSPQQQVKAYVEKLLENYKHPQPEPENPLDAPDPPPSPQPLPPPSTVSTVEDAARLIIDCLDPEHKMLIYQLAKETQHPLASYVMSPLLLARENGTTGVLIGEWVDKRPGQSKSPMPAVATCEYCGNHFTPMREGQRFCPPLPDDIDSCGRKWNMDRLHAQRDPLRIKQAMGDSPFAPLPSQRMVEHIQLMDRLNDPVR
jgi:hypothetical protein